MLYNLIRDLSFRFMWSGGRIDVLLYMMCIVMCFGRFGLLWSFCEYYQRLRERYIC